MLVRKFPGLSLPVIALVASLVLSVLTGADDDAQAAPEPDRPNLLLIMVDDMGYGDYSMAGNPNISTPNLDRMATRSASFDYFYVSPVCGLTRAALMTGCYPHRVGVHVNGRDLKRGTQTLASDLKSAGYATGIFGKWHLGDYYPTRPVDFGFEKSVVTRGGIIGQLADRPNFVRYSDPFLMNDGHVQAYRGYATDVHFENALAWMEQVASEGRSFFAYLAPNAPHRPYDDVPEQAYLRIKAELTARAIAELPEGPRVQILTAEDHKHIDSSARYYAMVERIDINMGRLFERLATDGLLDKTLVLFFSDNGPVPGRYNAGLKAGKGSVYEGGLRTQFFAQWPGHLSPTTRVAAPAAHIDLLPTLLDACGVELTRQVDGQSFWPQLLGTSNEVPERVLFFEAHQGKGAARQNFAVRGTRYKLVMPGGYGGANRSAKYELYEIEEDPLEQNDLAAQLPGELDRLIGAFDPVAEELKAIGMQTRRGELGIEVGEESDHPQVISRPHWKRTVSGKLSSSWQLLVTAPGSYDLAFSFEPADIDRDVTLTLNRRPQHAKLLKGQDRHSFGALQLGRGSNFINCDVSDASGAMSPAWQILVTRVGDLFVPEKKLPKAGRKRHRKRPNGPGKGQD